MQHRAIIAKIEIEVKENYFLNRKLDNVPFEEKIGYNPHQIKNNIEGIKWEISRRCKIWTIVKNGILKISIGEYASSKLKECIQD